MQARHVPNVTARVILRLKGRWRSLVAHLHDTQGVTGSSPVRPTEKVLVDRDIYPRFPARFSRWGRASLTVAATDVFVPFLGQPLKREFHGLRHGSRLTSSGAPLTS